MVELAAGGDLSAAGRVAVPVTGPDEVAERGRWSVPGRAVVADDCGRRVGDQPAPYRPHRRQAGRRHASGVRVGGCLGADVHCGAAGCAVTGVAARPGPGTVAGSSPGVLVGAPAGAQPGGRQSGEAAGGGGRDRPRRPPRPRRRPARRSLPRRPPRPGSRRPPLHGPQGQRQPPGQRHRGVQQVGGRPPAAVQREGDLRGGMLAHSPEQILTRRAQPLGVRLACRRGCFGRCGRGAAGGVAGRPGPPVLAAGGQLTDPAQLHRLRPPRDLLEPHDGLDHAGPVHAVPRRQAGQEPRQLRAVQVDDARGDRRRPPRGPVHHGHRGARLQALARGPALRLGLCRPDRVQHDVVLPRDLVIDPRDGPRHQRRLQPRGHHDRRIVHAFACKEAICQPQCPVDDAGRHAVRAETRQGLVNAAGSENPVRRTRDAPAGAHR
jgi:hypothetical protein